MAANLACHIENKQPNLRPPGSRPDVDLDDARTLFVGQARLLASRVEHGILLDVVSVRNLLSVLRQVLLQEGIR
jgi:hypothetical protein